MSINCFDSVLPKTDWFIRFFNQEDEFWNEHGLGPNQVKSFKRFLKDGELTDKNTYSPFARLISGLGWETNTAWGLILVNLVANNPQIRWYVTNLELGRNYPRDTVISILLESNKSKNVVNFVYSAYTKLTDLPLGTRLHWGYVTDEGDIVRTKCSISDSRVVLYGLFKFAEKCNPDHEKKLKAQGKQPTDPHVNDYKGFTLSTLLNDSIERDGISPTRIFGLNREDMTPMLMGLSAKYPEYITASFTHDLERITLAVDKSSQDVINLFMEDAPDA